MNLQFYLDSCPDTCVLFSMYNIQIEQDQNPDRAEFFVRFLRFLYQNENQKKLYTRYNF